MHRARLRRVDGKHSHVHADAVAAFFLFVEHRAHIFGAWPYLLILICPLMHLFMHRGHGGHGHHTGADGPDQKHQENSHESR
ncbi:DUF2933 domain-containing protein [Hydrogenophaga sp.]|uniref:DUF2933 domain-containing protein n=1 Tax=Hydrogenophaga sp. TaxID=1904254 RepID=UPI0032C226EB